MNPSLESLDWTEFLARPLLASPPPAALRAFRRHTILITGAGGSIGAALALRLATLSPEKLVLLEASESHLFQLQGDWAEAGLTARAEWYLGGVGDRALLDEIFSVDAPRIVFHAAAFKHVPLMEEQLLAAIENNIFGTQTLIESASAHGARVVLLSTDKAVEPASVMGATKRVAEQITLSAGGAALRLGNVLASRDSVAEIFARQIASGGSITVTAPAARRYFLTLDEAVNLLLAAAIEPEARILLSPALSEPHYIADLARFLAGKLAPALTIPIEYTHLRPGDREAERLWSARESVRPAEAYGLLAIESPTVDAGALQNTLAALRSSLDTRDLQAALAQLCALVPGYSPSHTVLGAAEKSGVRVGS